MSIPEIIESLVDRIVGAIYRDDPVAFAQVGDCIAFSQSIDELSSEQRCLVAFIARALDDIPSHERPLERAVELRTAMLTTMARQHAFDEVSP
ncbi:hypothetical protein N9L06_05320 [Mariniblastus sp.]|nr:hypothetical protein [Mariniblastus sp.]